MEDVDLRDKHHPEVPLLILVTGVAGVGKSTLSRSILRKLAAVYLDNNHVADAFLPEARSGAFYDRLRPGIYKALYTIAAENLRFRMSVLLDVPHVREMQSPEWRRFIADLAEYHDSRLVVIHCKCTADLLRARLESRAEARDREKLERWEAFLSEQPIDVEVPFPHLEVDTGREVDENAEAALRHILAAGNTAPDRRRDAPVPLPRRSAFTEGQ